LLAGARAMFSDASTVLPGTELPDVAALNSAPQPPLDVVHEAIALANAFSFAFGTVSVAGTAAPGDTPVAMFTRLFAFWNAVSSPGVFVQLAPTFPPLDINDARAHTDATVVASSTV
jgi:hypothetical protein